MSWITSSVVNKHYNPPPSLLPLCLQFLSDKIPLKPSREVLRVVPAAMSLPDLPAVSLSRVQACPFVLPVISNFQWRSREEMVVRSFIFFSILFLLCILICLPFNSFWLKFFFSGISWALESSVSSNRYKRLLELQAEVFPAAQHPETLHC